MKHLLKLLLCCFIYQHCFAQNNADTNLNVVARNLVSNIISYDKEKAWIVTDRTVYNAGETVYFKVFLVDSIRNYLQATPLKLFVDYVDAKDKIFNQLILDNSGLQNTGRFILPDSLPENYYWLRAYTNTMIHVNLSNIGVIPIYVVNKNTIAKAAAAKINEDENTKPVVHLYPEGGSIISGLNSTIALSIKDNKGNPLLASGIVKDKDDSIASFHTNKYGFAKFSYLPKWFDKYTVSIKTNDKYEAATSLPKVNFFAGQISIMQQGESFITARIALEDSIYSKEYTTYLIAVNGDNLCFTSVGKGMYNVTIPTSKFPSGIATLYLLNNNGDILSRRDVYINKQKFQLSIKTDKKNYTARDKVKVTLKLSGNDNQPEVGVFSLSVTDKNIIDTSFGFLHDDTLQNIAPEDADLILLAQTPGINPLNSDTKKNDFTDDTDFVVSGKITDAQDAPIDNNELTILSNQANPLVQTATTDKRGKFKFHLPPYPDNTLFSLQLNNVAGKSLSGYKIIFDANTPAHFTTPSNLKITSSLDKNLPKLKAQLITIDSLDIITNKQFLKPVVVKSFINRHEDFDTSKRISYSSHIITRDMIGNGPGMAGLALLNVPGLRLMNGYVIVGTPNGFSNVTAADEPLIVLDGVEANPTNAYTDDTKGSPVINFLNSLPVQTIDFIEVLSGPEAANYGVEGAKGVIAVNTASKLNNVLATTAALKTFIAKGFYHDKSFEATDYSNKQNLKSKFPDLRKTIYWNGNLVTNKNGEATVEFFTGDLPAIYMGVVSGVTSNGDKVYQTFTINRN